MIAKVAHTRPSRPRPDGGRLKSWANLGDWRSTHAAHFLTRSRHSLLRQVRQRPPLVLVHGGFSNHKTNWKFVKPLLEKRFTVYAIARRGRGETGATEDHSLEDESMDVVALIQG